jgi:hypothetical protein
MTKEKPPSRNTRPTRYFRPKSRATYYEDPPPLEKKVNGVLVKKLKKKKKNPLTVLDLYEVAPRLRAFYTIKPRPYPTNFIAL